MVIIGMDKRRNPGKKGILPGLWNLVGLLMNEFPSNLGIIFKAGLIHEALG